jgi:hypothetical protein
VPKLSYANVTATFALFVALGGSAFAVSKIDGDQIRKRSIKGSKLEKEAVTAKELDESGVTVPRALTADTADQAITAGKADQALTAGTADRSLTAGTAEEVAKLNVSSSGAGEASQEGSLLKMSAGDEITVLRRDPFTFTAGCTDRGGQNYRLTISVTSSEDGWLANSDTPRAAGESVQLVSTPDDVGGSPILARVSGFHLLATSAGAAVAVTNAWGMHVAGADCVVYLSAIG